MVKFQNLNCRVFYAPCCILVFMSSWECYWQSIDWILPHLHRHQEPFHIQDPNSQFQPKTKLIFYPFSKLAKGPQINNLVICYLFKNNNFLLFYTGGKVIDQNNTRYNNHSLQSLFNKSCIVLKGLEKTRKQYNRTIDIHMYNIPNSA